jgi:hypothetical protein
MKESWRRQRQRGAEACVVSDEKGPSLEDVRRFDVDSLDNMIT